MASSRSRDPLSAFERYKDVVLTSADVRMREVADRDKLANQLIASYFAAPDDFDDIASGSRSKARWVHVLLRLAVKGGSSRTAIGPTLSGEKPIDLGPKGLNLPYTHDELMYIFGLYIRHGAKGSEHTSRRLANWPKLTNALFSHSLDAPDLGITECLSGAENLALVCVLDRFSAEHGISKEDPIFGAFAIIMESVGLSVISGICKIAKRYAIRVGEVVRGLNTGLYGTAQLIAISDALGEYLHIRAKALEARNGKMVFDSAVIETSGISMSDFKEIGLVIVTLLGDAVNYVALHAVDPAAKAAAEEAARMARAYFDQLAHATSGIPANPLVVGGTVQPSKHLLSSVPRPGAMAVASKKPAF